MKNGVQMPQQQQQPQILMPMGYDMMGQPIYPQPVPIYIIPQGTAIPLSAYQNNGGSPQIVVSGTSPGQFQSAQSTPTSPGQHPGEARPLTGVKSTPSLQSYFGSHATDFTPPQSSLSSRTSSSNSLRSLDSSSSTLASGTPAAKGAVPPLSSLSSLQRMTPIRMSSSGSVPRVSSMLSRSVSSASLATLVHDDTPAKKKSRPSSPTLLGNASSFNSAESIDRSMAIFNITSPSETPLTTPMHSPTLKPATSSQNIHLPPISSMVRGIAELDEELFHRKLPHSPEERAKDVLSRVPAPPRPVLSKDNSSSSGILTIENLVNKQ
ncbi:hypothetical protein KL930_002005 [Ogataea haglerorum]|uniref:Uncharacterized protein n=1 Tax=Ogataea haglerorum TaxID=1937702 RepID=A0AAN6D7A6_9ASCO|nr:uncharacterized protein KL911_000390 [Ogataea haglerorum]KAG7699208.1 hypothetical protein KL915_001500 [Ogataea haglerorum]KAG7700810.1 hypothetical protein KL951_000925 [Ogataea haglerorum]KAG7710250.1 hypothetical protein KL914_001160 [Ogataea haglerorum]KAG7710969.1 hypothetical protein KL950_000935 [Ogataea haglerorum]KAG7720267.1 hypothetical protein KL913_001167 [Ogataea haglerorum]